MLVREPRCPLSPYILRPFTDIQEKGGGGVKVSTRAIIGNKDVHFMQIMYFDGLYRFTSTDGHTQKKP